MFNQKVPEYDPRGVKYSLVYNLVRFKKFIEVAQFDAGQVFEQRHEQRFIARFLRIADLGALCNNRTCGLAADLRGSTASSGV